jgi:Flp pilus assembly protein TadD
LRCNLARVLVRCGQTQEAIGQYAEALRIDRTNPNVHYELGVLLANLGELETAEQAFREALRLQPDHTLARDALEAVRAQRGQTTP